MTTATTRCRKCKRQLRTRVGLCHACNPRYPDAELAAWYGRWLALSGGGPEGDPSARSIREARIPTYQARAALCLPLFEPPVY